MNMKAIFIAIALAVVVASAAVLEAGTHFGRPLQKSLPIAMQATPAPIVGTPTATPSLITINTPTTVTVAIQITGGTVLAGGVNLLRLGPTGTQPTILGVMHDDGLNGDAVANDGIYTVQVSFNEMAPGQIQLETSAAFRGVLRRSLSPSVTLNIWQATQDSGTGLSFDIPPSFVVSPVSDGQGGPALEIRSSQKPLLLAGGALPPGESEADFAAGFGAAIDSSAYTTSSFDINTWFQAFYPGDTLQSAVPYLVAGRPAYIIVFTGEIGSGHPVVIVPLNNTVWTIGYVSTYLPGTPEDNAGLDTFYLMVQSLTFP